jgi:transcriptional regulator with XRE-family HTH domain
MVRLRIQELARSRGLSLTSLGRVTGLGKSTCRRYWLNQIRNVNLDTLTIIAQALDLPVTALLTDDDVCNLQERADAA